MTSNQITIALTKGRIEKDTVKLLEKAGFDMSFMADKGRNLIFESPDNRFRFLLVKAPDVTTYVRHGVADIGIVGKDVLVEHPTGYLEMLDLNFGLCKFSVASTEDYNPDDHKRKRIATKYPTIATDYFNQKGEDVEIISIQGSVEIAPVIGLADAIVDIVETGNTLVANGLKVYEDICRISARMIVNKASLKNNKEVLPFIRKILYQEQLELSKENRDVESTVQAIIEDVKKRGDEALRDYSAKFDKVDLTDFEVGQDLIDQAFKEIDPEVYQALVNAKENIESYHKHQLEAGFEDQPSEGVIRGQLIRPINRVGVYVPGGTAAYPSSVLMNVIPAKIAGVKEIIMITPPQEHFVPAILVAAKLAGVDSIYQVGGAQGVAALAFGTETIPKVDKITGPGNIFVATAKKQVYGIVGIDMIAGPSEIGVIADSSANPTYVAADLLSQAEHDTRARAILVTDSQALADGVESEIERQLKLLPREATARPSIENNGRIIIANDTDAMFELMDLVAPEHLEIAMDNAYDYLEKVENAGSVFLGHFTSEPIGDYYAGANHVLPTTATSRFSSALGVHDFVKRIQYTQYDKAAVNKAQHDITTLAYAEGLQAHAKAIEVRNDNN